MSRLFYKITLLLYRGGRTFGLLVFSLFAFNSCQNLELNKPVKEWFREYTETASIERVEFDAEFPENSEGVPCVPSDSDHTITFYLRNPQKYKLDISQSESDPYLILEYSSENPFSFTDSSCSVVKVTLPKAFLEYYDEGQNAVGGIEPFSPVINLKDPATEREFHPYHLNLHINTPPPQPQGATVMMDTQTNEYVVCFNLPSAADTAGWKIHQDLKTLSINSDKYDISLVNRTVEFSGPSPSRFKTGNKPDTLTSNNISGGGFEFNANGQSFYYYTGETVKPEDDKTYTITVTDMAGLSSTAVAGVKTNKLAKPKVFCAVSDEDISSLNTSGGSPAAIPQNTIDGTGKVCIKIPTACVNSDNEEISGVSGAQVEYKLYTENGGSFNGSPYFSKIIQNDSVIEIPLRQKSKIELVTKKPGYIDSDTVTLFVKVNVQTLWVSGDGSDLNYGTAQKPLASLQTAINHIIQQASTEGADPLTQYSINVSGTLTGYNLVAYNGVDGNAYSGHIDYNGTDALNLIIQGINGQATMDANLFSAQKNGRVLYANGNIKLSLKNLIIKGGNVNDEGISGGGGIYFTGQKLVLDNCTVTENKSSGSTACGGAVCVKTGSTGGNVDIIDSVITSNTADGVNVEGAGIYYEGSDSFNVNMNITNSQITSNKCIGSGDVYGGGICLVKGGAILTRTGVNKNYIESEVKDKAKGCGIYCKSGTRMLNLTDTSVGAKEVEKNTGKHGGLEVHSGIYSYCDINLSGNTCAAANTVYLGRNGSLDCLIKITGQLSAEKVCDIYPAVTAYGTKVLEPSIQGDAETHENVLLSSIGKFSLSTLMPNADVKTLIQHQEQKSWAVIGVPPEVNQTVFEKVLGLANKGENFKGQTIALKGDVVISDNNKNRFGTFEGILDGSKAPGGKATIKIIRDGQSCPLIHTLKGTVKNIILEGETGSFSSYPGAFVEIAYGGAVIENCINKINQEGYGNSCGGFVSVFRPTADNKRLTIKNCINYGNITRKKPQSGNTKAGSFVGEAVVNDNAGPEIYLYYCRNFGNILTEDGYRGDLIGFVADEGKAIFDYCFTVNSVDGDSPPLAITLVKCINKTNDHYGETPPEYESP